MPSSKDNSAPERKSADILPSACLLALAGGSLDAFLYLEHGRVFAGAMTGNAVLTGIAILSHNKGAVIQHVLPIAAFIVGVWLAKLLEDHLRYAVIVGLSAEIGGLTAASFLPLSFPDRIFVPLIALMAAYQISSFRQVDEYSYNSTFITGNLRTLIDGLYEALTPGKAADGLRKAAELGATIFSFIAGAFGGAVLGPRVHNYALWLPAFSLLLVLGIVVNRERLDSKRAKAAKGIH